MAVQEADAQIVMNQLAQEVANGRCILFLGAGVHAPPSDERFDYPNEHRPPIGEGLASQLADSSDWHTRYPDERQLWDLQRMALDHELVMGRGPLVEEVRRAVDHGKRPSPALRALAKLNFPLVVTTNYDQLFEQALHEAGKQPEVRVYNKASNVADFSTEDPAEDRPQLFKIHGDIGDPASIVITDEDYIEFIMNMNNTRLQTVPDTFTFKFKKRQTLFVGYSLLDYNLRVLFRTLRLGWDKAQTPKTYSVDYRPDPLILKFWQDRQEFVRFIVQDVWSFVPELYERVTGKEMAP
jgi:SIR2-like domain